MAWPLTPLRTFLANSVPVIDADFLNLLQEWVNDLSEGVVTVKALVVDAVGGAAAAGVPGAIQLARLVGSAAVPSGIATTKGQINVESIPTAVAQISGGFQSVIYGYGIHSVARHGGGAAVGDYDVTFQTVPTGADVTKHALQITGKLGGAYDRIEVAPSLDGGNRLVARIIFVNAGADVDFYVNAHVM